jgi:hypothetical protein
VIVAIEYKHEQTGMQIKREVEITYEQWKAIWLSRRWKGQLVDAVEVVDSDKHSINRIEFC